MPWCPNCKAEFRAGFTVCNTCGVPLIDHEPTGDEPLPDLPEPEERCGCATTQSGRGCCVCCVR